MVILHFYYMKLSTTMLQNLVLGWPPYDKVKSEKNNTNQKVKGVQCFSFSFNIFYLREIYRNYNGYRNRIKFNIINKDFINNQSVKGRDMNMRMLINFFFILHSQTYYVISLRIIHFTLLLIWVYLQTKYVFFGFFYVLFYYKWNTLTHATSSRGILMEDHLVFR